MRYEVRQDQNDKTQWVIWDTVEGKAFARYNNEKTPTDIVEKYYAAQLAAESAAE